MAIFDRGDVVNVPVDPAMGHEHGLLMESPAAELNSALLMKQAAMEGIGPAVFGAASVAQDTIDGRLCAVEITQPTITRRALLYTQAAADSVAVDRVAAIIRRLVEELATRSGWRGVRAGRQKI